MTRRQAREILETPRYTAREVAEAVVLIHGGEMAKRGGDRRSAEVLENPPKTVGELSLIYGVSVKSIQQAVKDREERTWRRKKR